MDAFCGCGRLPRLLRGGDPDDHYLRWETSGLMLTLDGMLTVTEAAQRVGRTPGTVRRWIREGRLSAQSSHGHHVVDPQELAAMRDSIYPMLPLPPEWQQLEDGTPVPNWAAAVALGRQGR
jgi:excisionase family DNA binding protein